MARRASQKPAGDAPSARVSTDSLETTSRRTDAIITADRLPAAALAALANARGTSSHSGRRVAAVVDAAVALVQRLLPTEVLRVESNADSAVSFVLEHLLQDEASAPSRSLASRRVGDHRAFARVVEKVGGRRPRAARRLRELEAAFVDARQSLWTSDFVDRSEWVSAVLSVLLALADSPSRVPDVEAKAQHDATGSHPDAAADTGHMSDTDSALDAIVEWRQEFDDSQSDSSWSSLSDTESDSGESEDGAAAAGAAAAPGVVIPTTNASAGQQDVLSVMRRERDEDAASKSFLRQLRGRLADTPDLVRSSHHQGAAKWPQLRLIHSTGSGKYSSCRPTSLLASSLSINDAMGTDAHPVRLVREREAVTESFLALGGAAGSLFVRDPRDFVMFRVASDVGRCTDVPPIGLAQASLAAFRRSLEPVAETASMAALLSAVGNTSQPALGTVICCFIECAANISSLFRRAVAAMHARHTRSDSPKVVSAGISMLGLLRWLRPFSRIFARLVHCARMALPDVCMSLSRTGEAVGEDVQPAQLRRRAAMLLNLLYDQLSSISLMDAAIATTPDRPRSSIDNQWYQPPTDYDVALSCFVHCLAPYLRMLEAWAFDGELSDSSELFVARTGGDTGGRQGAFVVDDAVPSFMRHFCGDALSAGGMVEVLRRLAAAATPSPQIFRARAEDADVADPSPDSIAHAAATELSRIRGGATMSVLWVAALAKVADISLHEAVSSTTQAEVLSQKLAGKVVDRSHAPMDAMDATRYSVRGLRHSDRAARHLVSFFSGTAASLCIPGLAAREGTHALLAPTTQRVQGNSAAAGSVGDAGSTPVGQRGYQVSPRRKGVSGTPVVRHAAWHFDGLQAQPSSASQYRRAAPTERWSTFDKSDKITDLALVDSLCSQLLSGRPGCGAGRRLPAALIVSTCISRHLAGHHVVASAAVLRVMHRQLGLLSRLEELRAVFLGGHGDLLLPFVTPLFEALRQRSERAEQQPANKAHVDSDVGWLDSHQLTVQLRAAVSRPDVGGYALAVDNVRSDRSLHSLAQRLRVALVGGDDGSSGAAPFARSIDALDCIQLICDLPWPVSAVVDTRAMRVYNSGL